MNSLKRLSLGSVESREARKSVYSCGSVMGAPSYSMSSHRLMNWWGKKLLPPSLLANVSLYRLSRLEGAVKLKRSQNLVPLASSRVRIRPPAMMG